MPSPRQALASRCRKTLVGGLIGCLVLHITLVVITDQVLPELRDPEYGFKLARLRERLRQEPDRPLLLLLGSSRTGYGLRPEAAADWRTPNGESPIVYNFGLTGSGPILELLCLHRLLRAGIHPDRVIIEVMPPNLHQEGSWAETNWIGINRLGWDDVQRLRRYAEAPKQLCLDWWRMHGSPWYAQRFCILSRYAPGWLPWETRQDIWLGLDRSGWMIYPNTVLNPAQQRRALEFARRHYAPAFVNFHITDAADRALRDLLTVCRRQGIAATLLLMPEGPEFQSWYPPTARAEIDAYLSRVSHEYCVAVIDARGWLPETAFFDSHHLHPDGATVFTQRFSRELCKPAPVPGRPSLSERPSGADLRGLFAVGIDSERVHERREISVGEGQ
ncbi:MAG TPA: hypothetical protein VKU02_05270 [Gemmataceae bacterium]|nr:hypothetical protein [Gemmataceae bacterium]